MSEQETEAQSGPPEWMDQDQDQDLAWAPEAYAPMDPAKRGRWALVGEDAVVWTDDDQGAGVTWLTQTELVDGLRSHFALTKHAGMAPTMAYELALRKAGDEVRHRETGPLSGVDELRAELMDED
jgi:hypothetical protein